MNIYYHKEYAGVRIGVSKPDSDLISKCFSGGGGVEINTNPDPWDGEVAVMRVNVVEDSQHGVVVRVDGDQMEVRGDAKSLAWLLTTIVEFTAEKSAVGNHLHLENFQGHLYFRNDSLSLVIEFDDK